VFDFITVIGSVTDVLVSEFDVRSYAYLIWEALSFEYFCPFFQESRFSRFYFLEVVDRASLNLA